MGVNISRTFINKIAQMSPKRPITVNIVWWDDDKGLLAQMKINHRNHRIKFHPYDESILVNITEETTNDSLLREIRHKMLHWRGS